MKRCSVREKGKKIGRKIVTILLIVSLCFPAFSGRNFFDIFAAVAEYGRTDDGLWAYEILEGDDLAVAIRPSDLGEVKPAKIEIPEAVEIQGISYTVEELADYAYAQCYCVDCLKKNKTNLSKAWQDEDGNYEGEEVEVSLEEVVIPSTVRVIGMDAFEYCDLGKVTFKENARLETIGEDAFADCTLKHIDIPASVTTIEYSAFYCCQLETITFEENSKLTSIDDYVFEESNLKEIALPESVTKIGEGAFWGCNLTEITIPAKVKSIELYAFIGNENLQKVTFAQDGALKKIRLGAFMECDLREVTIPASVTTIGVCAFGNNDNLKTVTFKSEWEIDTLKTYAFGAIKGFDYEEDYIEDMSYRKNSTVTQVNVENYRMYKWIAEKNLFDSSAKVYSAKTRVFLDEHKDENIQENVDMNSDGLAKIHIDDYVTAEKGYHFEDSRFDYGDTLNLDEISTGEIKKTDFESHGYPYVVIKANQVANKYEIAYDTQGGESLVANTNCQYGESVTITSEIPVRTGYEFIGWSESATGEVTVYQPGAVIYENLSDEDGDVVTLYAVWKEITKKVTIHFSTPEKKSSTYGYEITVMRNGATIQQHDVSSSDVGEKQIVISGAKIGEVYTIKCANYEKENGQKKYFQTTTKEVTIE